MFLSQFCGHDLYRNDQSILSSKVVNCKYLKFIITYLLICTNTLSIKHVIRYVIARGDKRRSSKLRQSMSELRLLVVTNPLSYNDLCVYLMTFETDYTYIIVSLATSLVQIH